MRKVIERALRQADLDLGELCNMLAGTFKAKFSSLADRCILSVSTVITGENCAFQSA
jgi:CheY-specific phosphatase CheX